MLQLVGEEPTPALFQPEIFEIVSSLVPETWIVASGSPGHLEFAPAAWTAPGFWESYFDGDPEAVRCFHEERDKIVACDP